MGTGQMFRPPSSPLATTPPPSPIEHPRQNDFRELTVTPEAEHDTWHDVLGDTTPPGDLERVVELLADEWAPITIPVGGVPTVPTAFLGDDRYRRSAVITNIGTEDLQLAPSRGMFGTDLVAVAASVYLLKAGASLTLTSTRPVFIRAPVGVAAGVSAIVERGTRTR